MSGEVSKKIKQFTDFLSGAQSAYAIALDGMHKEEKHLQDFLHAIEFEPSAKERSKICTKLYRSRLERRRYKDIVEELEEVIQFCDNPQNKKVLNQLTQLLGRARKVEKYHRERQYIPRVKEE